GIEAFERSDREALPAESPVPSAGGEVPRDTKVAGGLPSADEFAPRRRCQRPGALVVGATADGDPSCAEAPVQLSVRAKANEREGGPRRVLPVRGRGDDDLAVDE